MVTTPGQLMSPQVQWVTMVDKPYPELPDAASVAENEQPHCECGEPTDSGEAATAVKMDGPLGRSPNE